MVKKTLGFLAFALVLLGVAGAWMLFNSDAIAVLDPKGVIASQQRDLLIVVTVLTLIIIIPVFVLTFWIAWKFRAGNTKAEYAPEWDKDIRLESLWWGIPLIIIAILSGIIWTSSHALDPYKPLVADKEPLTINVVALEWKWLFLYPEQNIATVNYMQFPEDTPVNLRNTADAPMNSLWIPQLGGQIYAMSGMVTKLHLMANETGLYQGVSANISGEGFSGMNFVAAASTQAEFDTWVQSVKQSAGHLSLEEYRKLAEPSKNVQPVYYGSYQEGLYDTIVMKYMRPMPGVEGMETERGKTTGHGHAHGE